MSAASARILAIEDDPVLATHLQEHLSRRGFDVTLQGDGEAGLAQACATDSTPWPSCAGTVVCR
jgi:two-component system response regulator PfeR